MSTSFKDRTSEPHAAEATEVSTSHPQSEVSAYLGENVQELMRARTKSDGLKGELLLARVVKGGKTSRPAGITRHPSAHSATAPSHSNLRISKSRPTEKDSVPSRVYSYKPAVVKLPPTSSFSSDIVNLHPDSAIAKRITYSKSIATTQLSRKSSGNTDPTSPRKSQSLPNATYSDCSFTKRSVSSSGPGCTKHVLSEGNQNPCFNKSQTYTRFLNETVKEKGIQCCPPASSQCLHSSSLDNKPVLLSRRSRATSRCNLSCYYSSPGRNTSTPRHSLIKKHAVATTPVGRRDTLSPTTRAHFTRVSQTGTWNKLRLMRAIYAEIDRIYPYAPSLTLNLRPTRHFMSEYFRTIPPSDMTFKTLFPVVEVKWTKPVLLQRRRLYIDSCMLSGIPHTTDWKKNKKTCNT